MEWKAFKDEWPENYRLILFGNNTWFEVMLYNEAHYKSYIDKKKYTDMTHWCYIERPPNVEWESESRSTQENEEASSTLKD